MKELNILAESVKKFLNEWYHDTTFSRPDASGNRMGFVGRVRKCDKREDDYPYGRDVSYGQPAAYDRGNRGSGPSHAIIIPKNTDHSAWDDIEEKVQSEWDGLQEILIAEDRVSDTKKAFPNIANDIQKVADADPSGKQKYIAFAAKALSEKSGTVQEVIETIEMFHRYVNKLSQKDINQYNFKDLRSKLLDMAKRGDLISNKEKSLLASKGADKIYEDDKAFIYFIGDKKAAQKYGKGTKWCISAQKSNPFSEYRTDNTVFYFLISKILPEDDSWHKIAYVFYRSRYHRDPPQRFDSTDEVIDTLDERFERKDIDKWETSMLKDLENRSENVEYKVSQLDSISKLSYDEIKDMIVEIAENRPDLLDQFNNYNKEKIEELQKIVDVSNSESAIISFAKNINFANVEKAQKVIENSRLRWYSTFKDFIGRDGFDIKSAQDAIQKYFVDQDAIQKYFTSASEAEFVYEFAIKSQKYYNIDVKKLQNALINICQNDYYGDTLHYLISFAEDIKGADIEKLKDEYRKLIDKINVRNKKTNEAMGSPMNFTKAVQGAQIGHATGIPGVGPFSNNPMKPWDDDEEKENEFDPYKELQEAGYLSMTLDPKMPPVEDVPVTEPEHKHDQTDDEIEKTLDRIWGRDDNDNLVSRREPPSDIFVVGTPMGFKSGLGAAMRTSRGNYGFIPKESAWESLEKFLDDDDKDCPYK